METAEQILKAKGYDNFEINDIIQANPDNLDMKVRTEFGLDGEPLYLWEAYYRGDANEEVLEAKAKQHNCEDVDTLLRLMDARLLQFCEEVPGKINENSN